MKEEHSQYKTCKACGHTDERAISELDAAFEERRIWSDPCSKCGSKDISSSGSSMPSVNRAVLEEWSRNDELMILSQDEDLILGEGENLPLLEEFLRKETTLPSKKVTLLSAICVVVYDNTPDEDDDKEINDEFARNAIDVLVRNESIFAELDDTYICDYIKDVVYPKIGKSKKTNT
ncbi:hypothetical protein IEN85_10155 [Pelagicoccus sp. NFK12]|uniref:Uncharacterized protein n=1 Tax=Pelagicoccus enzymogenes TaxID=2773457 RepID=A0A927IH57_9BACT|nr:hypothetical protein [Pelagicoccus enzymogenes]MBD5779851.1 hypothetical protein [Pelagicoccus enzymogenes]